MAFGKFIFEMGWTIDFKAITVAASAPNNVQPVWIRMISFKIPRLAKLALEKHSMSFSGHKAATLIRLAQLDTTKCSKASKRIDFTTGSVAVQPIDLGESLSTTRTSLFAFYPPLFRPSRLKQS